MCLYVCICVSVYTFLDFTSSIINYTNSSGTNNTGNQYSHFLQLFLIQIYCVS